MGLYAIAAKHPLLAEYPKGQYELLKELFNVFGKRNIKRFLPPEEIIDAMTQAKLQEFVALLQQQMAKIASGAPPQRPEEMVTPGLYPETPERIAEEISPEAGLPLGPEMPTERVE
jgi:hypothetical protein